MLRYRLSLSLIATFLLGSCANKEDTSGSYEPARKKTIESFSEGFKLGSAEDGSPTIVSDRRSEYEGKASSTSKVGRDYSGKDFRTKQYQANRWGGNKSVERKSYDGNTGTAYGEKSPWYVNKTAQASGVASRLDRKQYATTALSKKSAYESTSKAVAKSTYYDVKEKGHIRPLIRGYKEQSGFTVNDSKDLLGR